MFGPVATGVYLCSTQPYTTMSNKQRLVLSIIDFLNQSIEDGTVKQDDKESLEVASASPLQLVLVDSS